MLVFRSAIQFSDPRPVKKGFSCRWDFDVRFAGSDHHVTYGHRVMAKTADAALNLAGKEALKHADDLDKSVQQYMSGSSV
jgi:hypothetical protein